MSDKPVVKNLDTMISQPTGNFPGLTEASSEGDANDYSAPRVASEAAGDMIGAYQLVEPLGKGGMGTVWRATQSKPIKRQVAIKLIKAGMDSAHVLARFDAERQALAMMDHPNIARVLDAGATPAGRPYFVMELVSGVQITDFADEHRLTARQRLELFLPVCAAIQHAHQKGVIHRDLKPSNILVGVSDGQPVPKVIDFGVAKAMAQALTDLTLQTRAGSIVGTLEYMAPEQANFDNADVDTRADIYSLGVLLYVLLTGSPPFPREQLEDASFTEMLRLIREVEPPSPSTRLNTSTGIVSLATARQTEPKSLSNSIKGEVDWIVMKCLEKDRNRRYETAQQLELDLRRYLADEPVLARPASTAYRMQKFVHRNRGLVIAAGLLMASLVAGMVGTTVGLVRANRALVKENEQRLLAQGKEREAIDRQKQAETAADILQSLFAGLDPRSETKGGPDLKAQLLLRLDTAAQRVSAEAADPVVRARLLYALATTFQSLGASEKALPLAEAALALRRAELTDEHIDTMAALAELGNIYRGMGRWAEALKAAEETLQLLKAKYGDDHPETLTGMSNVSAIYRYVGRAAEALPIAQECLRRRQAEFGPDDDRTLSSLDNLADTYRDLGRADEAVPLAQTCFERRREKLGADHPVTLLSQNNLGFTLIDAKRPADAVTQLEDCLQRLRTKLGPDHPSTLFALSNLALAYNALGRPADALPLNEECVRLRRNKLGAEHPDTLTSLNNLALNLRALKRDAEAAPILEDCLRLLREKIGPDHPRSVGTLGSVAAARLALPNPESAIPLFEEYLVRQKKRCGDDKLAFATQQSRVGQRLLDRDLFAAALPMLRECVATRQQLQPDDWTTYYAQSMLGGGLLGLKQFAEAEPLLLDGYRGMKQREAKIPHEGQMLLPEALARLVKFYDVTDKPDEAAKWRKELDDLKSKSPAPTKP